MLNRRDLVACCLSILLVGCLNPTTTPNASSTQKKAKGLLVGRLNPTAAPSAQQLPDLPATKQDEVDVEAVEGLRGNSHFAFDLYAQLRSTTPGNLCFSPASISMAMAMTYAGANGQTAEEMARTMHFNLPPPALHTAFSALVRSLRTNQPGCKILLANRLWGQRGFGFLSEFLEITRGPYDAELEELDFVESPDVATEAINDWVASQTSGLINPLIPAGMLDEDTRLVLTNAVYFKCDWFSKFDVGATKEAGFRVSADKVVKALFMRQSGEFRNGFVDGVTILEMPYAGQHLSMLVLLPEQVDGLAELENRLSEDNLAKWMNKLQSNKIELYFPKFSLTEEFQLKETLRDMGMTTAFERDRADFSRMNGSRDLFLSAVVHKAVMEVNEQGTTAAAATGAVMVTVSMPKPFRIDHPFVFLIRDSRTNSILFMGRVVEPIAK